MRKTMVTSLIGLVLAGAGGIGSYVTIKDLQDKLASSTMAASELFPVVVASRDISYGTIPTESDLRIILVDPSGYPEGALASFEDVLTDPPRVMLRSMRPGEIILDTRLSAPGGDAGVSSSLSDGYRAFTVRVNRVTGLSGFLRPGDRVDVIWSGSLRGSGEITQVIRGGMRVIAINENADPDQDLSSEPLTVTLEALPGEVAELAQAQSTGTLSLALVGISDRSDPGSISVNQDRLLGIQPVPDVEPERICTVRTRRGSDLIETRIPCQ